MLNIDNNFIEILKMNFQSIDINSGFININDSEDSLITIYPKLTKLYEDETGQCNNYDIVKIMEIVIKYGIRYDVKVGYILYTLNENKIEDTIITISNRMIKLYEKWVDIID